MSQQLIPDDPGQAVLDLLTSRSRAGTGEQVECYLDLLGFGRAAWRRKAGLGTLVARAEIVLALPPVEGPLLFWQPGQKDPDFKAFAWVLRRRTQRTVPRRTAVYWATAR